MNEEECWNYIVLFDEEFLKGGVILFEWCFFIVWEFDLVFVYGVNLVLILMVVFGIEIYLCFEYGEKGCSSFFELIDGVFIVDDFWFDLYKLWKYWNKWVYLNDLWDD